MHLSVNELKLPGITVDFNKNCHVTTFRYWCRDCQCCRPTKSDCRCSIVKLGVMNGRIFDQILSFGIKENIGQLLTKNHHSSASTKEKMLKFWKDWYRLNENKEVVCGGAAMYVSETTTFQHPTLEFANRRRIPVYYENDMDITVLVEQLIQNLLKKESELRCPVAALAQPRAQQQPWPIAYL